MLIAMLLKSSVNDEAIWGIGGVSVMPAMPLWLSSGIGNCIPRA